MAKYVKKPVVIDAEEFNSSFEGMSDEFKSQVKIFKTYMQPDQYFIQTLEGNMYLKDGDFIIKGVAGEFYPCRKDIFEKTYDAVRGVHTPEPPKEEPTRFDFLKKLEEKINGED